MQQTRAANEAVRLRWKAEEGPIQYGVGVGSESQFDPSIAISGHRDGRRSEGVVTTHLHREGSARAGDDFHAGEDVVGVHGQRPRGPRRVDADVEFSCTSELILDNLDIRTFTFGVKG